MIQTKMNTSKSLAMESEQAIHFLTKISTLLKQQRRHFDDAVVTHCIRLVNDYVEDGIRETPARSKKGAGDNERSA
jgi:hypothetical protein